MSDTVIRKEELIKDIEKSSLNGFIGLGLHILLGLFNFIILSMTNMFSGLIIITGPLWLIYTNSYMIIQPNEAKALQFFGKYSGTVRIEGFRFLLNPLYQKTGISLRIRNFESKMLKVNDVNANPVEIAAVVVWRVFDAAEALFEVDNYNNYVQIQSEAALRAMATKYPYDVIEDKDIGGIALSSHQEEIAMQLQQSVENRLKRAGIEVLEARISHLAYSQEIAQAMLRRQQASAVVAARSEIVKGAVGMVELALEQLSEKNIIELDEEKKATMVSNLLVVLCSETDTTPVINTGTLY
ncbi:MAG: SPFH domain-containing protein [Euryarchaeota archaeon]|jgi:regulator of protease activity HflC (stomatin/prohibitin superfamily)|nr:SPFH domain-containing protein [Euryarchaeota archaeon]MBT5613337.1 SPFH domain-containing protein [Euryarchaeota archaeon]MBT6684546.1 SPFH domain-containing protein [Euryarchaeota archaeon]MBT6874041.1 SPFH domain-containing protein [Euryarchaeota archaeon]MBT7413117.1 SPFH domain-containing protein [Euryarchaeota archaeon]